MKKLINVLFSIFAGLVLLASFVLIFIESRLLFSGDFLLCDNVINAFIRYFLKLVLSVSFGFVSFMELFKLTGKYQFLSKHMFFIEILLLVSSIVILIFGTNFIGIVCFGLYGFFTLLKTLKKYRK